MIEIDGSMGEGGGQVLRTSLGLSALSGTPFRIRQIRKHRSRPGLSRQHLTAVRAAAAICGARVSGAEMRSTEVQFEPGPVVPGEYHFAVGTAGSANLVLQTVLPALLLADGPSRVVLEGGTHNDRSPPFHFLRDVYAPLLNQLGPRLELELEQWGFYPAGGGRFVATITPAATLAPLERIERGGLVTLKPHAVVAVLPKGIGRRELKALAQALDLGRPVGRVEAIDDPCGPGNVLMVTVECLHATELFTAFGAKGKPAEHVARELADEVRHFLDADVPVGEHLADQLLLPLALAGSGRFRTTQPSLHTTTNAKVIERFLPVSFEIVRRTERAWEVRCTESRPGSGTRG